MLFLVEIEMKFCRNFANMLNNVQIHQKFQKFCNFSNEIREIAGTYREIGEVRHPQRPAKNLHTGRRSCTSTAT